MRIIETCERCEGYGADPVQHLYEDEITLCIECRGDGVVVGLEAPVMAEELRLSA